MIRTVTLLFVALLVSWPNAVSQAQCLHAFLVADTDSNIGESVRTDIRNIKTVLEAGLPLGRLRTIVMTGNEVTPDQIITRLVNLQIESNDAVIIFYSGHGGFDPEKGHYLSLTNGGRLYRNRVVNAITQPFTPRFWGIISDCCASFPAVSMAPILAPGDRTTLLTHLFLETKGRVDITSSRPEQVSLGLAPPIGGIFTWSLCNVLKDNASRRLGWDEIFRMTRSETTQLSESLMSSREDPHIHDEIAQRTQIPYSFRSMYGQEVNGRRLGLSHAGLQVTNVDRGSVADRAGLRPGMQIVRINGKTLESDSQMNTAINFSQREATIDVKSNGREETIFVTLAY